MDLEKFGLVIAQDETSMKQACAYFGWENPINYDEYVAALYGVTRPKYLADRQEIVERETFELLKGHPDGLVFYIITTEDEWFTLTGLNPSWDRFRKMHKEPISSTLMFVMGNAAIFGKHQNYLLRHTISGQGPFAEFWKDTMDRRVYKLFKGK